MTLKQITPFAAGSFLGLSAVLLTIRFAGDLPGVKEVKEGLKGNVRNKILG